MASASDLRDPIACLREVGTQGEGPHDIARAALALAALDHPLTLLPKYLGHISEMAAAAERELKSKSNIAASAAALSGLVAGHYCYDGDRLSYDDPRNADLITVIDRRRGLPVALGILYLHVARAGGLEACGLDTAGHFLLRITQKGESRILDPFDGGAVVDQAPWNLPPRMPASDNLTEVQPASDIAVLLRLQNNLKVRALEAKQLERALEISSRMVLFAPTRADLWFDLGRLREACGEPSAAKRDLERCLELALPRGDLHEEAKRALIALKRRLN